MRVLYFFPLITLSFIASAWPRPGDILEAVPDLGSVFDILSWPATTEDLVAPPETDECPVEGNLGTPPDSDTTEGGQTGLANNDPLDTNLFGGLQTMTEPRIAPPCGPDGSHYLLCCLQQWGAPSFVGSCQGGTCHGNFFRWNDQKKTRAKHMMNTVLLGWMPANRCLDDVAIDCLGGRYCCQGYDVSSGFYFPSASDELK